MPHTAVKVNKLIDTDTEQVQAKMITRLCNTRMHNAKFDHSTIHRFLYINVVVILSLKLCVKFEYSTVASTVAKNN